MPSIRVLGTLPESASAPRRRTAVLVCHGIGQQVPFVTVNDVATLLRDQAPDPPSVDTTVRLVPDDGDTYRARAELRVGDHEVHVYETYWAPIVAGKVTLREVAKFVLEAFLDGIEYAWRPFRRWLFNDVRHIPLRRGTTFVQILGLAVFIAAMLLGPVVLLVTLGAVFGINAWSLDMLAAIVSGDAASWTALTGAGLAGVLVASPLMLLVLTAVYLRRQAIDYLGDVVAYLSAHKVSPFQELRSEIQAKSRSAARFVYQHRDADQSWTYDDVIVVGHSLGSVIAYDTLNALIRTDNLTADPSARADVAARTSLFLTFGSPLDRTAFFFRSQQRDTPIREALAGAVQPMICDYAYRPQRWVNVYAHRDWISSPLTFYDDPDDAESGGTKRVENILDPDSSRAGLPLTSHTAYWHHPIIGRTVWEALRRTDPPFIDAIEPSSLPRPSGGPTPPQSGS